MKHNAKKNNKESKKTKHTPKNYKESKKKNDTVIKFDAESRRDYLEGFHKRKNERRAVAHFYQKEAKKRTVQEIKRKKKENERLEREQAWKHHQIMSGQIDPEELLDEQENEEQEVSDQEEEDDFGFGVAEPPKKKARIEKVQSSEDESSGDEYNNDNNTTEEPEPTNVTVKEYDGKNSKVTVTVQPFRAASAEDALLDAISDDDIEEKGEDEDDEPAVPEKRKPTESDLKAAMIEMNHIKNKSRKIKAKIATKSAKRWKILDIKRKEMEKLKKKKLRR
jgi:hypothetical protein